MAKTAALKNKNAPSKHSRAAKRASSPSINTDKSLKEIKPPSELKQPVLAANTGSGVKKSKHKVISSKARKRQERTMDRAEAVMDRTEKKVEKSKGRARNIQDRAKAWEDLNKKVLAKKAKAEQEEDKWEDMEVEDGDEEEAEVVSGEAEMADITEATSPTPVPAVSAPDIVEDEDLIL